MRFKEIKADLFTITDAYFMQCISADFKMGAVRTDVARLRHQQS